MAYNCPAADARRILIRSFPQVTVPIGRREILGGLAGAGASSGARVRIGACVRSSPRARRLIPILSASATELAAAIRAKQPDFGRR